MIHPHNRLVLVLLASLCILHGCTALQSPLPKSPPPKSPSPLPSPPPPLSSVLDLSGRNLVKAMTNKSAITVCISDLRPMVYCDEDEGVDSATFTGFDVEMLRNIFADLQLTENVDYKFKCVEFDTLLDNATNPKLPAHQVCDISAGGVTITSEREEAGVKFSYPYLNTGLKVAVKTSGSTMNGWRWLNPFTWSLWVIILATLVVFPVVIFFLEFFTLKRKINKSEFLPGYEEAAVRSYWTMVGFERLEVVSLGAKIAVMAFGFLCLLVVNTYTANLAAVLTVSAINSQIRDITDLRGKSVLTFDSYIPRLQQHEGIIAFPLDINSDEEFLQILDQVGTGELSAVITDAPYLDFSMSSMTGCRVRTLPQTYEPFSYGVIFRSTLNDSIIDIFSTEILQLQEMGRLTTLSVNFFRADQDQCGNSIQETSNQIGFISLWGLWAILGAACFLGFIVMLIARWLRFKNKNKQHQKPKNKKKRKIRHRATRFMTRVLLRPDQSFIPGAADNNGYKHKNTDEYNIDDVEQQAPAHHDTHGDNTCQHDAETERVNDNSSSNTPQVLSTLQYQSNIFGDRVVWEADESAQLKRTVS